MPTTDPEQVRLAEEVVRETRRLQAVERALRQHRAPRQIGDHSAASVGEWLDAQRARLDDLYAALYTAWAAEQQRDR